MKSRGLIVLLLSGWVLVCDSQTDDLVRRFHAVREERTRGEARRYCGEKFDGLAIIRNETENHEAMQELTRGQFWIGLNFIKFWRWTDTKYTNGQDDFRNWDKVKKEPDRNNCVVIFKSGLWSTEQCENLHPTMCYSADSDKHILVKQPMSWSAALDYCTSRYTSLSGIRNLDDNQLLTDLLQTPPVSGTDSDSDSEENNTDPSQAWIGLFRRKWVWPGRIISKYNRWGRQRSDGGGTSVVMDSSGDWSTADSQEKHYFLCYKDVPRSMLRTVKVRLRAGSANLRDPELQDAVLQQLKQKLEDGGITEDVKLRWRRQPDGQIFHREEEEEERAPPGDSEEEDDTHCV